MQWETSENHVHHHQLKSLSAMLSFPSPDMTLNAKCNLAWLLPRIGTLSDRRGRTAENWRMLLGRQDADCRSFFSKGCEPVCPYRVVVQCPDQARALLHSLRDRGIAVESWPDLPAEVRVAPFTFPAANRLRICLLFLPTHAPQTVMGAL